MTDKKYTVIDSPGFPVPPAPDPLKGLDWEDVRFFLALARHGSLSAAARVLGVNHATVSRRIRGLEERLGRRLFERQLAGYDLTAGGRAILPAATAMESAAATLLRQEEPQGLEGTVRLATTPAIAEGFLIARLGEFQRRHPRVDLELVAGISSSSLARHEADIALRLARPRQGRLMVQPLPFIGFGFYATETWRQRMLAGEAVCLIGFDQANASVPEAAWLDRQRGDLRIALRCNSQSLQAAAARAGAGIALLPHFLVTPGDGLVPVPWPVIPPSRELFLLTREEQWPQPQVQAACLFLLELFHREKARFAPAVPDPVPDPVRGSGTGSPP